MTGSSISVVAMVDEVSNACAGSRLLGAEVTAQVSVGMFASEASTFTDWDAGFEPSSLVQAARAVTQVAAMASAATRVRRLRVVGTE
jgi:hypothetical protein